MNQIWANLTGGVSTGEVTVWTAKSRRKSILSKIIANSTYGPIYTLPNGKFSATKLKKGGWRIEMPYNISGQFEKWCQLTMGEGGRNPKRRWRAAQLQNTIYFFRFEPDVVMATLRWAS